MISLSEKCLLVLFLIRTGVAEYNLTRELLWMDSSVRLELIHGSSQSCLWVSSRSLCDSWVCCLRYRGRFVVGGRKIHKEGYYRRVTVHKPLITKINAHLRVPWCKNHKHRSTAMWEKVIRSGESSVTIFSTCGQVHVWRTPRERYRPECLPLQRGDPVALLCCGEHFVGLVWVYSPPF